MFFNVLSGVDQLFDYLILFGHSVRHGVSCQSSGSVGHTIYGIDPSRVQFTLMSLLV